MKNNEHTRSSFPVSMIWNAKLEINLYLNAAKLYLRQQYFISRVSFFRRHQKIIMQTHCFNLHVCILFAIHDKEIHQRSLKSSNGKNNYAYYVIYAAIYTKDTGHTGTNRLRCTYKYILAPPVISTKQLTVLHSVNNLLIQKFTFQRCTMSLLFKIYPLV